jgi:hypothetical protein
MATGPNGEVPRHRRRPGHLFMAVAIATGVVISGCGRSDPIAGPPETQRSTPANEAALAQDPPLAQRPALAKAATRPPRKWASSSQAASTAQNLATNGNFADDVGWTIKNGAFDPRLSKTEGSGSFKLSDSGSLQSTPFAVTPGLLYTFSAYIRSDGVPGGNVTLFPTSVTSSGGVIRQLEGSAHANSKPGIWEEATITFTPDASTTFVRLEAYRFLAQAGKGDMWIDDLVLSPGFVLREPPSPKEPFNGSRVRVDALGNFDVLKDGKWQPFFPLCIAADRRRTTFVPLAKQGFNCDAWGGHVLAEAQKARDAGMFIGVQIAQFTNTGGYAYGRVDLVKAAINDLKAQGLSDSVLWYYWDNENSSGEFETPRQVIDTIRSLDRDDNGQVMHPIFVLQGNYGMVRATRSSNGASLGDVFGTYAPGGNSAGAGGSPSSMLLLRQGHDQTIPGSVCQINHGVGETFRSRLFGCIAHGGRAVSFWVDNEPSFGVPPVELQPWWPELPQLRADIDRLLPIIRSPNDRWAAVSSTDNPITPVAFGTRFVNGIGYLIVANETTAPQTVTFGVNGLPYVATKAEDVLNGGVLPVVDGNLTLTLPPAGLKSGAAIFELTSPSVSTTIPNTVKPGTVATTIPSKQQTQPVRSTTKPKKRPKTAPKKTAPKKTATTKTVTTRVATTTVTSAPITASTTAATSVVTAVAPTLPTLPPVTTQNVGRDGGTD